MANMNSLYLKKRDSGKKKETKRRRSAQLQLIKTEILEPTTSFTFDKTVKRRRSLCDFNSVQKDAALIEEGKGKSKGRNKVKNQSKAQFGPIRVSSAGAALNEPEDFKGQPEKRIKRRRSLESINVGGEVEKRKSKVQEISKPSVGRIEEQGAEFGDGNLEDVYKYYFDKKVERMCPLLETIYEIPKKSKDKEVFMSSKKFLRTLSFNGREFSKERKRRLKARHLEGGKKRNCEVSMETFKHQLESLENEMNSFLL